MTDEAPASAPAMLASGFVLGAILFLVAAAYSAIAIIQPGNEPSGAKWLDLLMLVISAGRERTEEDWRSLLEESGWEPVAFHEAGAIEARPCP